MAGFAVSATALLAVSFSAWPLGAVAGGSIELTADSFASETGGRSAFVMFKAPWCGHCKAMTPAWEQLGDAINTPGAKSGPVVGHVDCTAHQDLCSKQGVSGYPTLKVFDDETGEQGKSYEGGRDFATLKSYVEDNLAPKCSVDDTSKCSDKEKEFIEKMKGATPSAIADALSRLEKMKDSSMAPALKKWVFQRVAILKSLRQ